MHALVCARTCCAGAGNCVAWCGMAQCGSAVWRACGCWLYRERECHSIGGQHCEVDRDNTPEPNRERDDSHLARSNRLLSHTRMCDTRVRAHMHACAHTCTRAHMHARTNPNTHRRTHACTYTVTDRKLDETRGATDSEGASVALEDVTDGRPTRDLGDVGLNLVPVALSAMCAGM